MPPDGSRCRRRGSAHVSLDWWAHSPDGRYVAIGLSPSGCEAIRGLATARDWTRVPLPIVACKRLARDGRKPTLVNAHGACQFVNGPAFNARAIAFLEEGGTLTAAHVRGGGEYGKRWWRAGQRNSQPNTWRGLIDVASLSAAH